MREPARFAECFPNRGIAWLGGCLLVVGLLLTAYRIVVEYQTPGPFTPDQQGLCDFHNGIHFPARAAIAGESPYSEAYAAKYPVARQIPFFSPVILWMHAPLALAPLHVGEVLHFLLQVAMILGIAYVACRAVGLGRRLDIVVMIAALIVWTRAGHVTLFNGYFTLQLVLATYLAVLWADRRPIASGWMLLIVSAKPTYILPLGFLMLARGNWRAITIGAVLSIVGAVASLSWIAYHEGGGDFVAGASVLADQIVQTQEVHRGMDDESPVHSWTRLDAFAVVSKWVGQDPGDAAHLFVMFAFIAMPMVLLWKRHRAGVDDGIAGVTGTLLMTTMLVSLYHQSYDALLLVSPILGAVSVHGGWGQISKPARCLLIGVMALPLFNYLSTRIFLLRWELSEATTKVLTSLNGVSLAVALLLIVYCAVQQNRLRESDC